MCVSTWTGVRRGLAVVGSGLTPQSALGRAQS